MHTLADPNQKPAVRPRRRKRGGLVVFLVAVAALLGVVVYPPTFLFAVRQVLGFEARRHGFRLMIGRMDGSCAEPIWLYNARLSQDSAAGASTMIEIDKARTSFAWEHLFWKRDARVWRDLALDGVRGVIELPPASRPLPKNTPAPLHGRGQAREPRLLLPSALAISHASLVIRQSEGALRLEGVDLQASDIESGRLTIGALSLSEPGMTTLFSNCQGTLLLQDSKLMLANMKLTDALTIASASADLPELLRGRLRMAFDLNAFSGNIQGEIRSGTREERLVFESSGTFANISVAQLGAFFGEDADGSIKQGKFTFHGSPRDLAKATFTTRFEAGNFRWGARRWNSLVAGATYIDHRLQHLEFQLSQAHNSLMIKGSMNVPQDWREWWKADFDFAVAAKIDNLSELSALLGPGFGDIFGKLTADGSVRGANGSFDGQLIVSGSHLSFRKAPLDELQAAIKLQGNEIQVTNAEFTHGEDYLRAQGVVNILGAKRYWGEVKASVADLALYASFLQPPIAPEAFGGGLVLDWSGDGAASAHSGAFTVRLSHIHPLVTRGGDAGAWQPLDLSAEATYSPDSIFFSTLALGNGETSLTSRVAATPRSLTLQGLKVLHGESVWLAGDAQVPLNVWAAWRNPATASWWNFESPCKLDIKLDRFSIRDVLALGGHQAPLAGELTGSLKSAGTLAKLTAEGHLGLRNAEAAIGSGRLKGAGAVLDFHENQLTVKSSSGEWNGLDWSASGAITASDVRAPALDLAIQVPASQITLGSGLEGAAALDLRATGRPDALALSGTAQLQTLKIARSLTMRSIPADAGMGLDGPLPALALAGPPGWKLDIHVGGDAQVTLANTSGSARPALEMTGSPARPVLAGSVEIDGFEIAAGHSLRGVLTGTPLGQHFSWTPEGTLPVAGHADLSELPLPPFSLGLGMPFTPPPVSPHGLNGFANSPPAQARP